VFNDANEVFVEIMLLMQAAESVKRKIEFNISKRNH
jgi:hypothetical protein